LEGMLKIQEKLVGDQLDIATSLQNLDGMLKMQTRLANQSRTVADAIQTLELLSGFRDEIAAQIQSLGELRHDLVEISLMETSVAKVARMMKPLVELGNLRRLSDDEVRHAARSILEGRTTTRVSKNSVDRLPASISGISAESSTQEYGEVPLPNDE
jgi:hypothetical protein